MFKKALCLLAAAVTLFAGNSFHAPAVSAEADTQVQSNAYNWGRAAVLGGGFITGIVFNPSEKDLVYARTDIGGAYRWDQATSSWIQLLDSVGADEWSMLGVDGLATDPVDPNRVYLATGMYTNDWTDMSGAIMRSTDKGKTWARTMLPFKMGGNMPGRSMGERIAIDPNNNSILYLGARSGNGLWRSTDYGVTWSKVSTFTAAGNIKDFMNDTLGVVWVTFDPATGTPGHTTQTIYAGVADTGNSIYRSTDGGQTWEPVPGQPAQGFMPHHGVLASNGALYVTYTQEVGPYNGGQGSVWKFTTATGVWTDISPTGAGQTENAYGGLTVDAQHPNTLMVATMNKWWPDENIYRSTDGGATWKPIWKLTNYPNRENKYTLDISLAPWLDWGTTKNLPEMSPKLGWMMDAMQIDPFNSDRMMYGTGATLYGTNNMTALDRDENVNISVFAKGIEETAVLGLISPPSGAPLLSSLGDIGGFRHEDLTKAPPMITNPTIGTSTDLDYAELNPDIVVRVGNSGNTDAGMGVSTDNGKTWHPAANAWPAQDGSFTGGGWVAVGADGSSIVWGPEGRAVSFSTDLGATWTASKGIPDGTMVSSDRVNPNKFYGFASGKLYVSTDGGATFTESPVTGLPNFVSSKFKAVPGTEGDIWLAAAPDNKHPEYASGLFHSTDSGQSFTKLSNVSEAATIGFGKAAPNKTYMALYSYAKINGVLGIFRSDDAGATWVRINDDQHQFGNANRAITGDPRVYGRVYVATNGLGIVLGDKINTSPTTTDNAPAGWVNKDVTVTLTANDTDSYTVNTYYTLDGGVQQQGTSVPVTTEGKHTITYWSVDGEGNAEAPHTATVQIDKTAPSLNVNLDKTALWPPNHKLIAVNASVSSSDTLSGIASVVLTSITSSEADQGLGSEDLPNDIQGAQQNTSDTDFLLRAERFAKVDVLIRSRIPQLTKPEIHLPLLQP